MINDLFLNIPSRSQHNIADVHGARLKYMPRDGNYFYHSLSEWLQQLNIHIDHRAVKSPIVGELREHDVIYKPHIVYEDIPST